MPREAERESVILKEIQERERERERERVRGEGERERERENTSDRELPMKPIVMKKTTTILFWLCSIWVLSSTTTAELASPYAKKWMDTTGGKESSGSELRLLRKNRPLNTHPWEQRERRPRPPEKERRRRKRPKRPRRKRPQRPHPRPRPQHKPRPQQQQPRPPPPAPQPHHPPAPERCAPLTVSDILLSGTDEVPSVNERGFALATVTFCGDLVCLQMEYFDLTSPIIGLHIHAGLYGENGEVLIDLSEIPLGSSPIDGCIEADPDLVYAIQTDLVYYYINVHTREYPTGEIRGQIDSGTVEQEEDQDQDESCFSFGEMLLSTDQQVDVVDSNGYGSFWLSSCGNEICIVITYSELSSPVIRAHIQSGNRGDSGPVVVNFDVDYNERSPIERCVLVDDDTAEDIFTNPSGFFVNVLTEEYSQGEIRGQIEDFGNGIAPGEFFPTCVAFGGISLNGDNHVPPVGSAGKGEAEVVFCQSEVCIIVETEGLSSPVIETDIHVGRSGDTGQIVIDFGRSEATDNAVFEACVQGVDDILYNDMLNHPADFYINVKTNDFRGGELRGQLEDIQGQPPGPLPSEPCFSLGIGLNGDEQVPPVTTNAEAKSEVAICDGILCLFVDYVNLSSNMIGATINEGFKGSNGGTVFDFGEFISGTAATTSNFEGCLILDDDSEQLLIENPALFYVNIATEDYPEGEIRGQLESSLVAPPLPPPPQECLAVGFLLTADQAVPPTDSVGAAFARLDICGEICVGFEYMDLSSPVTMVDIHAGSVGENGPQVLDLTSFLKPEETSISICFALEDLDPALVARITEDPEYFYVDVHTESYPSGEIRGQFIF